MRSVSSTPIPSRFEVSRTAPARSPRLDVPAAKLGPPALRHRTVRRPRLVEWLGSAVSGCRLTLVTGPPGAGKTTLLSSWIESGAAPGRLGWVTVDVHDNAPWRFWSTVLVSLARSGACRTERLDAIATPPFSVISADLPAVIADALPVDDEPTVLVLDDLHELRDARVLDGIAELMRIAPASFRLVLSTRHDPRLPLPRLRVAGQLAEIRAADLAFTAGEARELLVGHGVTIPPDAVELLVQRTEGWAGALALTAMTLRGADDPVSQIGRIAGDERAVADYLATEILDELPHGIRDLLIHTAIVDRVCGPLADALTGSSGGAVALERLERQNCFVVGLDERRQWYRYHRLFLELLRSRLSALSRADRRELHGRAARWLAENGLGVDAIEHAIAAEQWRLAADLIAEHWMDAFLSGRSASLRPLLEDLPAELVEREAGVAAALAAIHLDAGDIVRADRCLALAHAALLETGRQGRDSEQLGVVALLRARCHGDLDAAVRIADEVVLAGGAGDCDDACREQRTLVLLLLGATEVWTDRLGAAAQHLRAAVAQARFAEQEYLVLGGLGHLAVVEIAEGRLEAGVELAREARGIAERRDWLDAPQVASALLALGWAQLLTCDTAAAGTLDRALTAARSSSDMPLRQATAALRALACLEGEGARRGLDILAGARAENASQRVPALVERLLDGVEIRLQLAVGDEREALERLASLPPSATTGVLRARHALAHADPAAAISWLAPWVGADPVDADVTARTEALVLDAVARHRCLDSSGAADSLERALALADADRALWVFMQAGSSVRELLAQQLRHGTAHRGLVESLRVRLEQLELAGGASSEPLLEPLSARERALLSYLETMLSTDEIARELFVSANTVKSHTKSIYRKLGVTRRRQAVLRGRALRLL